jgi:hypothetical protein
VRVAAASPLVIVAWRPFGELSISTSDLHAISFAVFRARAQASSRSPMTIAHDAHARSRGENIAIAWLTRISTTCSPRP